MEYAYGGGWGKKKTCGIGYVRMSTYNTQLLLMVNSLDTIKKNIKFYVAFFRTHRNRLASPPRKCIIPLREVEDNGLKLRGTNKLFYVLAFLVVIPITKCMFVKYMRRRAVVGGWLVLFASLHDCFIIILLGLCVV